MHISVTEGHFHISLTFMTLNFDLHIKNIFGFSTLLSRKRNNLYLKKLRWLCILPSQVGMLHIRVFLYDLELWPSYKKNLLASEFCAAELGLNHITKSQLIMHTSVTDGHFHNWVFSSWPWTVTFMSILNR